MLIDIELTICHMICTVLLYTHMRTINVIDPHHCMCGYMHHNTQQIACHGQTPMPVLHNQCRY